MGRGGWVALAAALWGLLIFVVVATGLGTFVAPAVAVQVKAQGGNQLPTIWQLLVDVADLCNHRWFIVFPLVIGGAALASHRAFSGRGGVGSASD